MSLPEIYPMPLFVTLTVGDLVASQRWYEAIGFKTVFAMNASDGTGVFAHLRWIRYADLLLRRGTGTKAPKGLGVALNFRVDHDIDALARHAKAAGANVVEDVGDRPWNARDFTLRDPDGFTLTFTYGPLHERDFDVVMRGVLRP
jgi:predicted lactoylglutathione lyase